jgi:two-component system, NtrC family, sensor kinase
MKIRWKVTALIAALFVVLVVSGIFVAKTILMPSFVDLENKDANIAMRRVEYALDSTLDQLRLSAGGWGNWTDAYRFMQDRNHAFIDEQITVEGLKQLNINALMFFDLDGRFVTSIEHDFNSIRPLDLDFMRSPALPADFPWRGNLHDGGPVRGLLRTNRGILLIAAAPVLDGYGHGPIRGMVMMGRLLTPAEIRRLGAQAQVDLSMLDGLAPVKPDGLVETDNVTRVYKAFADIYGRPAFTLRVDIPRSITQRGHLAVHYASAYLAAAAVIVLTLLVLILDRVVLNPLDRVTRHAVAIGEGRDLTTRLDFKRADEIGVLAHEFDRMVARVAESRSKLIDQSFHAGFAELAKGVLHNLGNAMTPIGVRLSGIRDRVRSAPIEDVESALVELGREDVDPGRRRDLEEFVRLACAELASVLRDVAQDAEVMSRQTSLVQSALSEQMRATRNEHVVESVHLPELLAQTLDVVPDAARRVLVIDADRSLADVGVVTVPRTVVRLVLQNLIINAADAVRESGRTAGSLRVAAEILRDPDGGRLHLSCTDDGVGIARANLERIFEKGFSTKSKETNYGIGLHWCANSLGALGGHIWAASEGAGRGTSVHFTIPLAAQPSVQTAKVA